MPGVTDSAPSSSRSFSIEPIQWGAVTVESLTCGVRVRVRRALNWARARIRVRVERALNCREQRRRRQGGGVRPSIRVRVRVGIRV